ncbi:MAG: GTP cyclohydrolase I [Bacteroidaceae bacterium]|nr:GTP cyclohydrolase I [Bacteroidaceae bacterium]
MEDREKIIEGLKENCHNLLTLIGEDTEREGLIKTPDRVARAILDTTSGYFEDPHAILRGAMFKEDYSQMVIPPY